MIFTLKNQDEMMDFKKEYNEGEDKEEVCFLLEIAEEALKTGGYCD